MKLYNSLSKEIEDFSPIDDHKVGFYSCGMTVYDYSHIGHGRKYVTDDLLRRALETQGYKVNFVQNVTDVGHLTSDADEGEDKLEKGAKKAGKTVWEVAEFFTKNFYDSMDKINIKRPTTICKATDHIEEQINLVKKIIDNGYGYDTPEAVYFDVSKFENYGKLFGQSLEEKKVSVRDEVKTGSHKKNPQDFALWFKRKGRFSDHIMHWNSPWGDGFPGWHIECSAMSMKYLGDQFDIHSGGEDHKPIHHPNEIAQAESATGKSPFVKYWVHTAFLTVDGTKMSKSLNNFYTVDNVIEKGYEPLSLRYFYLTAHYRKKLNFTWEALDAAAAAYKKLQDHIKSLKKSKERSVLSDEKLDQIKALQKSFWESINNDLNMPQAIAVLWEVLKSNIPSVDKLELVYEFDEVLGLDLKDVENAQVPQKALDFAKRRQEYRDKKDFKNADKMRDEIENLGYLIRDTESGFELDPA